jgi:hypothetical protein
MRRIRQTLCLILRRDFFQPGGDVKVLEDALEHGERGLGLVEGDFVAGFVDAEEADCEGVCEFLFSVGVDGFVVLGNLQLPYCRTSPYSVPSTTKGS